MFKNYLKTAARNILRYKGFSLINIAGLTIGVTGCLLIGLFIRDEWQFDKSVPDNDRIFRVYNQRTDQVGASMQATVPPMYASYLQQNFPQVESTARIIMESGKKLWEVGEIKGYEEKGLSTEAGFLRIFPFRLIKGDYKAVLDQPDALVITEQMAARYFGAKEPIGKQVKIDKRNYVVKAVIENVPAHFHLDFDYLMSFTAIDFPKERMNSWGWQQFYTYLKIRPGSNANQLEMQFQLAVKKEAGDVNAKSGFSVESHFQPLKHVHLQSSGFEYDNARRGNETYVKALGTIAIFVLLIACFNFINLATARSFRRAKEIGVRKVAGAGKGQLLVQFTGESVLLAFISVLIAVLLSISLLPSLNRFTGKSIAFNPVSNPLLGILLLLAAICIGALAGLYPAFILSRFQPSKVLKGSVPGGGGRTHFSWLRQGLVVIQFALSVLLIVSTTIVYRQISYLHNKDLGFNKDQLMLIPIQGSIGNNIAAFKNELEKSPNIVSATAGYGLPGDAFAGDELIVPSAGGDRKVPVNLFIVDHDYIKTLGLKLVAGRDFSREISTDTAEAFIINETGVKELGYGSPEKAIGRPLKWDKWLPDSINPQKKGRIVGVVRDFHYKSLHEKVSISVLQIYPPVFYKMAIRLKTVDLKNTLAFVNSAWIKYAPEFPLDYKFMDESFDEMYQSEDKLSALLWIFTLMAIFVGCMGLFGLAAFSAEQRHKEIGIRKVLGASVANIISMLSINFLQPVFIASLIAFPIAWYSMNNWLQDFPYRVSISWWVFGIAALAALVIALLTVSFQAIKAAIANPVKSLRTE
jgi:putative ABC transport system permease protein